VAVLHLAARWLVPVAAPPVEDGALLIGEDGRVVAAGRFADVPRPPGATEIDLGDAAILPGLVNVHAHLELTALRGLVRGLRFPDWVAAVRRLKDALGPEDFRASARWGVLESFAAGITATGDTGSTGAAAAALAALGARGVAYQEVFAPDPAQAEAAAQDLEAATEALVRFASERLAVGVSPHAPYTVSDALLRAVVALARRRGWPVAMHLAESPEEDRFVRHGDGPFAAGWRRRGIEVVSRHCSPVAWVRRAGLLELRPLLIHCVTADGDDAVAIAKQGATVAHCPWSNAVLHNGRADLALLRRLGVTVGVGTDSVAPGGGLDLFREIRLAALACPLTPREMLRLATADAAAALGLPGTGSLVPGAWGDVCVVGFRSPALAAAGDPEEALALGAAPADVRLTAVAGHVVYYDGAWPDVDAPAERQALGRAAARARAAAAPTAGAEAPVADLRIPSPTARSDRP
jgi:cytosine/adenosine deaminase-related metal-dependent hydrolase